MNSQTILILLVIAVLIAVAMVIILYVLFKRMYDKSKDEQLQQAGLLNERVSGSMQETMNHLQGVQRSLGQILETQRSIHDLSRGLETLNQVMTNKQARGRFGEIQLMDIVKDTLPKEFYEFQASLKNTKRSSITRVDCLLKMPEPSGSLAIDSKFPWESFVAYSDAGSDQEKLNAKRELAARVRTHLRDIADKYIIPGITADCALMFLPSEAVFSMIHTELPEIVGESQKLRVFIVSPSTMMATIVTLRAIFRDYDIRVRSDEILNGLRIISENVGRFNDRLARLSQHFNQAQKDVNDLGVSGRKIVDSVNKLNDLGTRDKANSNH